MEGGTPAAGIRVEEDVRQVGRRWSGLLLWEW